MIPEEITRAITASNYAAGLLANPTIVGDLADMTFLNRINGNALKLADNLLKQVNRK